MELERRHAMHHFLVRVFDDKGAEIAAVTREIDTPPEVVAYVQSLLTQFLSDRIHVAIRGSATDAVRRELHSLFQRYGLHLNLSDL
jgi:hypothetical protein